MTKHVLAMNGGGIFGLQEALVLAAIEAKTGKAIADLFDMVAGCSTGGILACAVAARVPGSTMVSLYRDHGADIFHHTLIDQIQDAGGIVGPKYSAAPLEGLLRATLSDKTLADAAIPLLVPASRCAPVVGQYWFRSWLGPNFPLWQVARATSAAPYYFPPADVVALDGTKMTCVDGGLWSNDPEDFAALSAMALWRGEKVSILSLGTGSAPISVPAKADWGGIDWAPHILDILMACTEGAAAQRVELLGFDRICLDSAIDGDMDDVSIFNMAAIEAAAAGIIASALFAEAMEKLAA